MCPESAIVLKDPVIIKVGKISLTGNTFYQYVYTLKETHKSLPVLSGSVNLLSVNSECLGVSVICTENLISLYLCF